MSPETPPTVARYRVVRSLGAGKAKVYYAEDPELGRPVVLKVVPSGSLQPEDADRLREEARALAAFSHPAIATLYEIGESRGALYLAMEYVAGETVAERLDRSSLSVREAVDVALRIADALAAAHRRGWIHRDVKSANVMLGEDDAGERRVKLLDFGLAGRLGSAGSSGGTPGYMSPEVIRGVPPDERSEVFSLGVVLFEMLAGHRPFRGDDRAAVLRSTLDEASPTLGRDEVPLAIEEAVRRALAKDPRERFGSAEEFAAALRRVPRGFPQPPAEAAAPERTFSAGARRLRAALATAALLGAGLDAAVFAWGLAPGWIALGLLALFAPRALERWAGRRTLTPRGAGVAFRGLAPFQEADHEAFFGRDLEAVALVKRLSSAAARWSVLYGESGSGKTSLLRAGVLPRLRKRGFLALYIRGSTDPVAAALAEAERQSGVESRAGEPLTQYLRRISLELEAEIVLVFDQFEEFFLHFRRPEDRAALLDFLVDCHNTADLPVKLLVALRSDFLYLINAELAGRIPEPLASTQLLALKRLGARQAEEILRRSAQRARLLIGEALLRELVRDLDAGDGTVLPTELQIVGQEIQTKRILTLAEYRRAGGKETLVHAFVEDVVQTSPDPVGARLFLSSLISDENTRLALTLAEIAHRTQRGKKTLLALVAHFVRARLVREIQEKEPWRYELQHEYLIEKIHRSSGRVMDARQRANRIFKQHLASHAVGEKTRIPLGQLWFIHRYSDVRRHRRARRLLAASLRWGLFKAAAFGVLLLLVAAALSVREEWRGERLRDGPTAAVRRVVFSHDGKRLFTASEDGTVIVWDFESRQRLRTLTGHQAPVTSLAVSPDGRLLALGDQEGRIMIRDTTNFKCVRNLLGGEKSVVSLAFSRDGRWLLSSAERSRLWSTDTWLLQNEVSKGMTYGTASLSFDNRHALFSKGFSWELDTNRLVMREDISHSSLGLSSDGSQMIGINSRGTVRFWNLTNPGEWELVERVVDRRAHHDHGRAATFSADGRWAATAAEDIVLWDAASREITARLEHTAIVWDLAFSPQGRYLVSTHGDGAVLVWDITERKRVADLREHSAPVRAVDFSPDGRRLVSASEDRTIIVWDLDRQTKEAVLRGHSTRVNAIDFSPTGAELASLDQDGNLALWDLEGGGTITQEWNGGAVAYAVAISPDGRFIASSRGVYEEGRNALKATFQGYSGHIYGLAFSADGQTLAAVTERGDIRLWAVDLWRPVERLEFPGMSLISVSFSPDGRSLVTGEDSGAVRLWQTRPLRMTAVLGRHSARAKAVDFSPTGRHVASVGDDQTIRLWDVRKKRLVKLIGTHAAPTLCVAFSPDERQIAVGGHDHSVRLYTRYRTVWGYELP